MIQALIDFLKKLFEGSAVERPSPQVTVKAEDINYDDETHTLTIRNFPSRPIITTVTDTNSMDPFIDAGQMIILQPDEPAKVGDIAMYAADPQYWGDTNYILHCIIGERDDYWIFKGDNNKTSDPPVPKEAVVARLKAVFN
uniref:Putative peptidase n=1 Tax=viral metagenome TaxID=1070528 RepID=A0A6M3J2W7_9ZZZZ